MASDSSSTFTLRIPNDQIGKIKDLAERYKVTDAQIIRWGLDALFQYVERHGGRLHLPIDFDLLWEEVQATAPKPHPQIAGLNEPVVYRSKRKHTA